MSSHRLNLLWPSPSDYAQAQKLFSAAATDLNLSQLVTALSYSGRQRTHVEQILRDVIIDPAVITYRQQIVDDLLDNPQLLKKLDELLPQIDELAHQPPQIRKRAELFEVVSRLNELELFVDVVTRLQAAFAELSHPPSSDALIRLQALVGSVANEATFIDLKAQLPDLVQQVRTCASVTIGVNLDSRLRPIQATLLTISAEKFTQSSMLDKIFGRKTEGQQIKGAMHSVPNIDSPVVPIGGGRDHKMDPLMVPLFRDLSDVLTKVSRPVARTLKQFGKVSTRTFIELKDDLAFYVSAVKMIQRMQQRGVKMIRPKIRPANDRIIHIKNNVNINLALRQLDIKDAPPIIPNDVNFNEDGRIQILTGPNGGGKTTYVQAVGLSLIMAQAGLYIPAESAEISPVDNIYTHYQIEERPETATGRFGEEALRLRDLFGRATPNSLLLLNESLSSTSFSESLYLAQDLIRVMRGMGLRVVFATHLHELASSVDTLNQDTQGRSRVISLVASRIGADWSNGTDAIKRSYKIEPGPPIGRSFAKELAAKYGVSLSQLQQLLTDRGISTKE